MSDPYSGGCSCGKIRYTIASDPIFALTFDAMPTIFTVTAASLDNPSRFAPNGVTYASQGHQWDVVDPALPRWKTMPGA